PLARAHPARRGVRLSARVPAAAGQGLGGDQATRLPATTGAVADHAPEPAAEPGLLPGPVLRAHVPGCRPAVQTLHRLRRTRQRRAARAGRAGPEQPALPAAAAAATRPLRRLAAADNGVR